MGKILDWHPNTVNQWVRYYGDVLAEWAENQRPIGGPGKKLVV